VPVRDRPASLPVSSRIAYGIEVTPERLATAEKGEEALHALGFWQFCVHCREKLVRIQIAPEQLPCALTPGMARRFVEIFKPLGPAHVTLDVEGYRSSPANAHLTRIEGKP
jgi:uncharacterized protein